MSDSQSEMAQLVVNLVNNSEISSIKQVVTEILRIIKDETTGAKDLKEVIEKDPPLYAKVLKLANSAQYGYPRTINSIQEAIVCIGFDTIKEIALNQKVCELFMNDQIRHGYSRWSLWEHSCGVAICSKLIYRREFRERGDDIYAAGLLHDIGIIVEDQFFTEQFDQALSIVMSEIRNLHEVEHETLNIDHAKIGKAIAVNWEFPDELIQAIGCHHEIDGLDSQEENLERFVRTIYLADFICHREKIGFADTLKRDTNRFHDCLSKLKIKTRAVDILSEELKEEIKKVEKLDKSIK